MRTSIRTPRIATLESHVHGHSIPAFLCPGLLRSASSAHPSPSLSISRQRGPSPLQIPFRRIHVLWPCRAYSSATAGSLAETESTESTASPSPDAVTKKPASDVDLLPLSCPGCGAMSQTIEADEAGFYSNRRVVREYTRAQKRQRKAQDAVELQEATDQNAPSGAEQKSDGLYASSHAEDGQQMQPPLCDRCHQLLHHHTGVPVIHPTIEAIHDTLLESPHRYNHVYHVLDAADFPMSLIPSIHRMLDLVRQRSQNRRSKIGRFRRGRKDEMSFIITRSDLLAPKKELVDSMMPYLIQVLRDALGRAGRNMRLGNVRCVSAKRGWWTKTLKEDIWRRGGGGWMVGKVNVGKSNLFEHVFPKGRTDVVRHGPQPGIMNVPPPAEEDVLGDRPATEEPPPSEELEGAEDEESSDAELDLHSLLPPPQPETPYPVMPVVSDLPGTTASPIRLSYGNGRGELVDLPGLVRGELEQYVQEEHRRGLVMRARIKPEQQAIKYGQSLLLGGGLVRITPLEPDQVLLACAFTPIEAHVTATDKAIGTQTQERESGIPTILAPGVGHKMRRAGTFKLRWDDTKDRAGPLTRKDAVALRVERLPFRVFATDILIEGCGWVELAMQIRTKEIQHRLASARRRLEAAHERPERETPDSVQHRLASARRRLEAAHEKPKSEIPGSVEHRLASARRRLEAAHEKRESESSESERRENENPEGDHQVDAEQPLDAAPDVTRPDVTRLDATRPDDASPDDARPEKKSRTPVDPLEDVYPQVEIVTPEGRFVGQRRPMNAYAWIAELEKANKKKHKRPRRSMKGVKKKLKLAARSALVTPRDHHVI